MNTTANKVINFRTSAEKQQLIDRAAELVGKNRTEFVLEASCEKAREVLADRTQFTLAAKALRKFNAIIEAPLPRKAALRRLLKTPAPWEP